METCTFGLGAGMGKPIAEIIVFGRIAGEAAAKAAK